MPDPSGPTRTPSAAPGSTGGDLRARFVGTLDALRTVSGDRPDAGAYADRLLARWAEPQRRYHTTDHLTAVLDHVDSLAGHADDPGLVRLAAWFHDAVYRPDRSENEERSAQLAERALAEAGLDEDGTREVARLVRLTVTHAAEPGDRNGAVLCDADLAVLASEPDAYAAYAAAVREEYGFVPDDAFRAGRAAVLEQLLALPRLFRTPYGAEKWEAPARANLAAELRELTRPAGPGDPEG
ncbi:HD domain-containing protein [Streptomyces sp. NPDC004749]